MNRKRFEFHSKQEAIEELLAKLADHPEGLRTSEMIGTKKFHGMHTLTNRHVIALLRESGKVREFVGGSGNHTYSYWKLKGRRETMKSQCEQVMEILNDQMKRLLARDPNDPDDFKTAYSAALAVIRALGDVGIIGDTNLLMLAREAMESRGKSKQVALSLFADEFDHPSMPPWERVTISRVPLSLPYRTS
jgi:hypothetical protein